jgi:altronate dehydratase small subunit
MAHDILVVDARDNVATALRPLEKGESLEIEVGDSSFKVTVLEPIPFGHKIALVGLDEGDEVRKYGEVIGLATRKIAKGQHVHVQNVKGPQTGRDGS